MASQRKPRPSTIYRMEITHRDPNKQGLNSTTQTFNKKLFDQWLQLPPRDGRDIVFSVGQIDWGNIEVAAAP